jgi:DNA segregation ATPase FtsK/SpoIIIE-like protein
MAVIEVAIGPSTEPGTFTVDVVDSPAGEATATVALDVENLLAGVPQLQDAVLASAVSSRRALRETERPLREIGHLLFQTLLGSGEVAGRYRASAAVAAERGEGLRVVLRVGKPALAGLPWEAMFDQVTGAYVCRTEQLVRHVPVASVPPPLKVSPPLRILVVISSPRGLPPLDVEKEADLLAEALADHIADGLVELHWAKRATWFELHDLLMSDAWHVVHFIGHGDFDSKNDQGVLALVRDDGRAALVGADRFIDLLRQARPMPRLVVLNSCAGAVTGQLDVFSGTATALVRGGVSAVAAMQFEISDPAAKAFSHGFYAAIARGRGIDEALSSARVAILGIDDRTLEWVTPVLYLRGDQTRLFTFPASERRRKPREDAEREAAEQRAREQAEREAAEQRAREQAEREAAKQRAREQAEQEAAEQRVRERAERDAAERRVRERAEREAAERRVRERAEREAAERRARQQAEQEAAQQQAREQEAEQLATRRRVRDRVNSAEELLRRREYEQAISACAEVLEEFGNRADPALLPQMERARGLAKQARSQLFRRRLKWAGVVGIAAAVVVGIYLLWQAIGPPEGTKVEIPATQAWTDTGINCTPGSVLEITAAGTITHDNVGTSVRPDGNPKPNLRQYNVPEFPDTNHAALIGSIDRKQPYFPVGEEETYTCTAGGRLFLGINDIGLDDNSGKFIATIKPRS